MLYEKYYIWVFTFKNVLKKKSKFLKNSKIKKKNLNKNFKNSKFYKFSKIQIKKIYL